MKKKDAMRPRFAGGGCAAVEKLASLDFFCYREARMQNGGDETDLKLLADKLLKLSFSRWRVVS